LPFLNFFYKVKLFGCKSDMSFIFSLQSNSSQKIIPCAQDRNAIIIFLDLMLIKIFFFFFFSFLGPYSCLFIIHCLFCFDFNVSLSYQHFGAVQTAYLIFHFLRFYRPVIIHSVYIISPCLFPDPF